MDHEPKIKVYRPTDTRHLVVVRLNENAIYYRLPEFLLAHQISVRKFRLGHCLYQLRITFLIFSFFWEKRLIVKPKLTFLFFIIACHRCNSHPRTPYPPQQEAHIFKKAVDTYSQQNELIFSTHFLI